MLDRFSEIRFCNSLQLNLSLLAIIVSLNKKLSLFENGNSSKTKEKKNKAVHRAIFNLNSLPYNELTYVDNACGNIVDKNGHQRLDFPNQAKYLRFPISQMMVLQDAEKTAFDSEIFENACVFAK
ncbi:MAG: hypothetical protein ACE5FF_01590 [Saprospiraceae bacterium]